MKQKFNGGGFVKSSHNNNVANIGGQQSADNRFGGNMEARNTGSQINTSGPIVKTYSSGSGSSSGGNPHSNDNSNISSGNTNNNNTVDNGFISNDNKNVSDGNELSISDQISEQNAASKEGQEKLKLAQEVQDEKKRRWGLDKYADDNNIKIDTSNDVIGDILDLKDAAEKMMEILGLDPTKKKSMQIALNYLSNDQWGSQLKLRNAQNAAAIDDLVGSNKDGWKTWGTRLRGDAAWKGVGPMTKQGYSKAMRDMTAKYKTGSLAWKYQRALINSHKPLKSDNTFSDTIASMFIPGFNMLKDSKVVQWLNSHNEIGEIGVDENGIFNFEFFGDKININNNSPLDTYPGVNIQDYIVEDKDKDGEVAGNYQTYSWDNTGVIETPDEDEEDDNETQLINLTLEDDLNPIWWDLAAFEKIFSGYSESKPEVIAFGKEGGIVGKK